MKANIWTFLVVLLLASTIILWIIPAFFEWQKSKHNHEEKMADKAIELKAPSEPPVDNSKKGFKDKMMDFFGKAVTEVVPALAGKMIGGV